MVDPLHRSWADNSTGPYGENTEEAEVKLTCHPEITLIRGVWGVTSEAQVTSEQCGQGPDPIYEVSIVLSSTFFGTKPPHFLENIPK